MYYIINQDEPATQMIEAIHDEKSADYDPPFSAGFGTNTCGPRTYQVKNRQPSPVKVEFATA